jgi:hypothetical protein
MSHQVRAGSWVAVVQVSWNRRSRRPRRIRRRRLGRAGCLLWLVAAILILLLLSLVFGGFRLGSKQGLGNPGMDVATAAAAAWTAYQP